MKSYFSALCLSSAACALKLHNKAGMSQNYRKDNLLFESWRQQFGLEYDTLAEYEMRKGIWNYNVKRIDEFNKENHSYELGMNEFGAHTEQEFFHTRKNLGLSEPFKGNSVYGLEFEPTHEEMPSFVDWRSSGRVSSVKNQGHCGSCYTFSVTGSIEGAYAEKTGNISQFSEQEILDCGTGNLGINGCGGGNMDAVFNWIIENGGLETERQYPYDVKVETCKLNKKSEFSVKVKNFVDIPWADEESLAEAIATVGPVSVAIDASGWTFMFYKTGVYNPPTCSPIQLNHAVLAVGYGTDEEEGDYYLVKNGWGVKWGDKGYIKMARNRGNKCGIATMASYPIIE